MPPIDDEEVLEQLLAADDGTPDYRNDGLSMAEHAEGYGRLTPLHLPPARPVPPAADQPPHVLVYDLETTGLDPTVDIILEVGACLVDTATLDLIDEFTVVAALPAGGPAWWDEHVPPMARDMHEANGLYAAARASTAEIPDIEQHLIDWLRTTTGTRREVAGAGSGVAAFDTRFLAVHMPRFARCLTYWSHDVGHIRRLCDLAGRPDLAYPTKAKPHRALDDARLHLEELRHYRALLQAIPFGAHAPTLPRTTP